MAQTINRDMDQGANFSFSHTVKGDGGTAMNISSGYTAHAQMRKFYTSPSAITLTASITGSTGNINVSLGASASANVKPGVWFYDVELHSNGTPGSANVQRVVQGMINVYPEITKIP
jgi:hypothetical protein